MRLPTQTFTQLVRGQVAAIQGAASGLIDFTIGSIVRAIVESTSQVTLWLQGLIIQLLTVTRLATSVGPDVDSWGADYGLPREPGAFASTEQTFGRFSASQQTVVPIGANVETSDGSQQFVVIVDTANAAYRSALGGYVLPIGTLNVICPVQALVSGSGANCVAGALNTITSSIPGVDFCTNAQAVQNGEDEESDAAYRLRFIAWINSLSRAVRAAIQLAVTSVHLGVTCTIVENQAYNGASQPGYFYVVVNDGTGFPPASLLAAAGQAVEAVRGLTITYGIFPPVVIPATVSLTITLAPTYDPTTVMLAVQGAIGVYMAGLNLGATMAWTRLAQLAYDASPGVIDVSNIRLNGGQSDIAATLQQVVQASSIAVATQ